MRTYRALLGTRSLLVEIDNRGVVILPPDIAPLADGCWLVYSGDTNVGWFEVIDGVVGLAYPTQGSPTVDATDEHRGAPRPRGFFTALGRALDDIISNLIAARTRHPEPPRASDLSAFAREMELMLRTSEVIIALLENKETGFRGTIYRNLAEMNAEKKGVTPDFLLKLRLAKLLETWETGNSIDFLSWIAEGPEDRRYTHGYVNKAAVQAHLTRLEAVLAWQPPAATAPSEPTTPAAESEAGGESATT